MQKATAMRKSIIILTFLMMVTILPAVSLAFSVTVTYTYDDAGRLVSADYGDGKSIYYAYDLNGNLLERTFAMGASLAKAVTILKIIAGNEPDQEIYVEEDIDNDGKIGLEEVGYILQKIAGTRYLEIMAEN